MRKQRNCIYSNQEIKQIDFVMDSKVDIEIFKSESQPAKLRQMTKRRPNTTLEKRNLSKNVHLPLKSWRKVELSALLTVQYLLQL